MHRVLLEVFFRDPLDPERDDCSPEGIAARAAGACDRSVIAFAGPIETVTPDASSTAFLADEWFAGEHRPAAHGVARD